ncbi:MAG TPA: MBL fold metallo-hydrolase, partial [Bacillota bacterium]|nr:MBL fold metallo-hydrolase [Bacillota bacterium]
MNRYLITIELVLLKENFENQLERIYNYPNDIYLISKYNLVVDDYYESTYDHLISFQPDHDYDRLFIESLRLPRVYQLSSKPKKFVKKKLLLNFLDVYRFSSIEPLKKIFSENESEIEVRVYNVDQGNMNTIHLRDKVILYDWGTDIPSRLIGTPSYLNLSDIRVIFLSHHHQDHYNIFVNQAFPRLKYLVMPNGVFHHSIANFLRRHPRVIPIVLPLSRPRRTT